MLLISYVRHLYVKMVLAFSLDLVSTTSSAIARFDLSIVVFDACGSVVQLRSMIAMTRE